MSSVDLLKARGFQGTNEKGIKVRLCAFHLASSSFSKQPDPGKAMKVVVHQNKRNDRDTD